MFQRAPSRAPPPPSPLHRSSSSSSKHDNRVSSWLLKRERRRRASAEDGHVQKDREIRRGYKQLHRCRTRRNQRGEIVTHARSCATTDRRSRREVGCQRASGGWESECAECGRAGWRCTARRTARARPSRHLGRQTLLVEAGEGLGGTVDHEAARHSRER